MRKVDKYENVNDENFKRVLGVKRSTYEEMVNQYKKAEEERKAEESLNYLKKIEYFLC